MFKRIVSVILAVIISAIIPFAAFAEEYDTPAEDVIIEEYQYTQSAVAGLSISSKNANCSCLVTGQSGKATKITVTLELQKKSGASWNSIYARGKTVNGRTASYSYTYNSLSRGTYRTKVTAKVYSGNKSETVTAYSASTSC